MQKKHHPEELIRMLYEIADDAEAPANSRLTAIKEILDRTVGKGMLLDGEEKAPEPVQLVFRRVDDTNSPGRGGERRFYSRMRLKRCSAARRAAAKATDSCWMRCGLQWSIPARGSSCCGAPCPNLSAHLFRHHCGYIRRALPAIRSVITCGSL